mmetsp:Transcript_49449/g.117654  ORF Transcript_49449/g.117654 Transcript_49449/m.117654 type:complete len:1283 (-) Transcript_49449:43-3891(-)
MAASKKPRTEEPAADARVGRIEKLIVENFKSYEGLHEIGPFEKFTCIIGPNGAGKSNIMDAISFCLGIKAKHLRGDKLRDLIYCKEADDPSSNTRRASVTLVFRTANDELLHFGRTITSRGEGSYRYGPASRVRGVGYDEFLQHLAAQNVFVKARNFLVFQGDVAELARRQGLELTRMLETISGSDQLKESYEKVARELEIAEERCRLHFQHRREVEGMMSVLEKQRSEFEHYRKLEEQKDQIALQKMLFKICCAESEAANERHEIEELNQVQSSAERQLRLLRKQVDELQQEEKRLQQEVDKASARHANLSSELSRVKPDLARGEKEIAHVQRKLQESEDQVRLEEQRQKGFQEDLQKIKQNRVIAEADLAKLKAKTVESEIHMSEAQRLEYDRLMAQHDAVNLRTREQLREIEEQLAACSREATSHKRDIADLEQQEGRLVTLVDTLAKQRQATQRDLSGDGSAALELRQRASTLGEELKKLESFRDSLHEEQRTRRYQLDLARSRKERLEQVESRQRLADELREAFPDQVLGRISEVLLPTQKRFDLPLQMSLGVMAEAFIVTTAEAGRQCVQYLKRKRIPQESFLAMDRMAIPNVGPLHLLTNGKKARRLATVCVQQNEKFLERHPRWAAEGEAMIERASNLLLNGTVIADDLAEAKATAYKDARKQGLQPKVVTLQGEVIQPNGNMSVQSSSAAAPVEFGGADQLHEIRSNEKKLLEVEKDLAAVLEEIKRKSIEYKDATSQAAQQDGDKEYLRSHLRRLAEEEKKEKSALVATQRRSEELKSSLKRARDTMLKLEAKKGELEAEMLKAGKKTFGKLNRELGVADVREVMHREERERRKLRLDIEESEDYVRKLQRDEVTADQRCKNIARLRSLRKDCDQYRKETLDGEARKRALMDKSKALAEQCKEASEQLRKATAEHEQREQDVKSLRADLQRAKIQSDDANRKLKLPQEKLRTLLIYKGAALREMSEQRLPIPLAEGSRKVDLAKLLSRDLRLEELVTADLAQVCDVVSLNFAALPQDRLDVAAATRIFDTKAVEADFDVQMAEISRELEALNPNQRAEEDCALESKRLLEIRQKADEATHESQRLAREFEAIKSERLARFNRCYNHVQDKILPFYKELTSYDGSEGGSAYLTLEDTEEPYNGGVTYTACPPGKRFFPLELLSGGESAIASMALLFAMHSFKPPPFMILDEVDAAFDKQNTRSLMEYLKKLHFQSLVISLKDTFFSHSDSIIGIYKDKPAQCSGTLTLPLRELGNMRHASEPETEIPEGEDVN